MPTKGSDGPGGSSRRPPLAPHWATIAPGSFDAITRPESDERAPQPTTAARVDPEKPAARPRRTSYTWLQMLTLALVAFVLGFLVWLLVIRGSSEPGATGAFPPPPPTPSSSGTPWSPQGELL